MHIDKMVLVSLYASPMVVGLLSAKVGIVFSLAILIVLVLIVLKLRGAILRAHGENGFITRYMVLSFLSIAYMLYLKLSFNYNWVVGVLWVFTNYIIVYPCLSDLEKKEK